MKKLFIPFFMACGVFTSAHAFHFDMAKASPESLLDEKVFYFCDPFEWGCGSCGGKKEKRRESEKRSD